MHIDARAAAGGKRIQVDSLYLVLYVPIFARLD